MIKLREELNMNKNIAVVLLIFLIPIVAYWGLSRDKSLATLPGIASNGAEILKFSSPMCYECQELEKIFNEVYPEYANRVSVRKIDVTQNDKTTKQLIKEYNVILVPTCVFKNTDGNVIRKTEGAIQPRILENYIKEQLHG